MRSLLVQSGFSLKLPFHQFVTSRQLPRARLKGTRLFGAILSGLVTPPRALEVFALQISDSVLSRLFLDFRHSIAYLVDRMQDGLMLYRLGCINPNKTV